MPRLPSTNVRRPYSALKRLAQIAHVFTARRLAGGGYVARNLRGVTEAGDDAADVVVGQDVLQSGHAASFVGRGIKNAVLTRSTPAFGLTNTVRRETSPGRDEKSPGSKSGGLSASYLPSSRPWASGLNATKRHLVLGEQIRHRAVGAE